MTVQAILTTNNAYDSILLADGTALQVTQRTFREFLAAGDDILTWNGNEDWCEHTDNIETAAQAFGNVLATITDGELVIVDAEQWTQRLAFYNSALVELEFYKADSVWYQDWYIKNAWVNGKQVIYANSEVRPMIEIDNNTLIDILVGHYTLGVNVLDFVPFIMTAGVKFKFAAETN